MRVTTNEPKWQSTLAVGRASLWIVRRVLVGFAVLMLSVIVFPNRNLVGWALLAGFPACAGLVLISFIVSWRLGRLLRRDYPDLAAEMGLDGKFDWRNDRTLQKLEFREAFFKRDGHLAFAHEDLRFAANTYIWVTRIATVVTSLMIASIPALFVATLVFGQHAP